VAVSLIGGGNLSTRRKPPTCRKSLTNVITQCCIEYTSPWTGFELTILVVIGTDCSGSCKSKYYTITTTTVSAYERGVGFRRYIGPRPGERGRWPWISDGPISISHWHFILIFYSFLGVFSIQILNFERSLCLSWSPKAVLLRIAKFILEALTMAPIILNWTYIKLL